VIDEIKIQSPFLCKYLELVENTESPILHHVWSAISAVSVSLGRRCWLNMGEIKQYPNNYIVLVGPPATRKSTSISIIKKILSQYTNVKFGPNDTAGHRQGLITALQIQKITTQDYLFDDNDDEEFLSFAAEAEETSKPNVHVNDRHALAMYVSEFTRMIGHNNALLLDFLNDLYDGVDVEYQLKNERIVVKEPIMGILAGVTPIHIAQALPAAAQGQGFMSRLLFVYAAGKEKSVPRPKPFNKKLEAEIGKTLSRINLELEGAFDETEEAYNFSIELYERKTITDDPRFVYYNERRYAHLLKLAMAFAAMNVRQTIEKSDYIQAEKLLTYTEAYMPDALGEFGMSSLSQIKDKILTYLRAAMMPIAVETLYASLQRDAKHKDFTEAARDLVVAKKIKQIMIDRDGHPTPHLMYIDGRRRMTETDLLNLLGE